jgi:hypothetical protein
VEAPTPLLPPTRCSPRFVESPRGVGDIVGAEARLLTGPTRLGEHGHHEEEHRGCVVDWDTHVECAHSHHKHSTDVEEDEQKVATELTRTAADADADNDTAEVDADPEKPEPPE